MSATNFNTKNDTYRKLLGNGLTYRIPRFQRDYSWTEEEWEDLWQDILGTVRDGGEPAHYMGYLVLQTNDEKTFDVIDGQQRLTTLSLVVLAVLKNLERVAQEGKDADNNRKRAHQIRQTYIGYLDPVTLVSRSKMTLNRNNDSYYQTYLVPLAKLPQRGFRASEHSLRKAFDWFERHVHAYARTASGDGAVEEGVALASLVDRMSDRLIFTVITVTDELNAYKVFETLNARGVRLSATDLLKNYLFSVLHAGDQHEHEMKVLEDRWESLVGRLGSESFPDFLRSHWNSRHSFVRQSELFKAIRTQVRDRDAVFELLRGMEGDLDTYLGLTNPEPSEWPPSAKALAGDLRMFSVRQPFSLLLAARRRFDVAHFELLLRACVIVSFRYNVIGSQPTHEQERVYNELAEQTSAGRYSNVQAVIAAMGSIYPGDTAFRAAFAEKVIRTTQSRNRRVVRYILGEIEQHLSGQNFDLESETLDIEHVLPQHPGSGWDSFTEEEIETLVFRLGNMVLLQRSVNRAGSNGSYGDKRPELARSQFALTRRLAQENGDWTPSRIAAWQQWMANQATAIWRIGQLS
jgi:hypothetical protein